jgi:hypothetical protein
MNELCTYLGQDLEHPMCIELKRHMDECPHCQEYLESVKLTVKIFKESNESVPIPQQIKHQLWEKLHLKK